EGAGEEAVEVVEGRLGDSLAISGVELPAFGRGEERSRPQRRRVGEGAEAVVADGDVGREAPAPLGPPLSDQSGEAPRPVLVGAAEIDLVAGAEILRLMLDGRGETVPAEAPRHLGTQREPLALGAVQGR